MKFFFFENNYLILECLLSHLYVWPNNKRIEKKILRIHVYSSHITSFVDLNLLFFFQIESTTHSTRSMDCICFELKPDMNNVPVASLWLRCLKYVYIWLLRLLILAVIWMNWKTIFFLVYIFMHPIRIISFDWILRERKNTLFISGFLVSILFSLKSTREWNVNN